MFDPQVQEVTPHVAITQGVQPANTLGDALSLATTIGVGVHQGEVMRRLTGAERSAMDVVGEDVYGTFEEEDGQITLAVDTDLTRIANARRTGAISADRARAEVNLRVRQAINEAPMYADAIVKRAERFFGELGGSRSGGVGGSLLQPTSEERLEQKIHERNVEDLRKEQMEADQLGLTVEDLRRIKRNQFDAENSRIALEHAERMSSVEFNRRFNEVKVGTTDAIYGAMETALEAGGGLLNEEGRTAIRTTVQQQYTQLSVLIDRNAASLGTEEAARQRTALRNWRDDMIGFVDTPNAETVIKAIRDNQSNLIDIEMYGAFPQVIAVSRVNPELGAALLTVIADPQFAEQMSIVDPMMRMALRINDMELFAEGLAPAYKALGSGNMSHLNEGPLPLQSNIDMTTTVAAGAVSGREDLGEEGNKNAARFLANRAEEVPSVLSAFATPNARVRVMQDEEYRDNFLRGFERGVRGTALDIRNNDLLPLLNIEEREPTPGNRTLQRLGLSRAAEAMEGATFAPRAGNVRVTINEEAYQQRLGDMRDPFGAVIEQEGQADYVRASARNLEKMIRLAQYYPTLEIAGEPLMDYINRLLGMPTQEETEE